MLLRTFRSLILSGEEPKTRRPRAARSSGRGALVVGGVSAGVPAGEEDEVEAEVIEVEVVDADGEEGGGRSRSGVVGPK